MGFSHEWERIYQGNKQINQWPFTDVVSYVMRYVRPKPSGFRVLELGCGSGPNIPFFLSLDFEYYGIEGSSTIIEELKIKFDQLKENLHCGDFTKEIPFSGKFDIIVDRSALTHNSTEAIRACLKKVYELLKPGGFYIGIDWFSTMHSDYQMGKSIEDVYTRGAYTEGQFSQIGRVHFSDQSHLLELFHQFKIKILEHKTSQAVIPQKDGKQFAVWNLVAVKP